MCGFKKSTCGKLTVSRNILCGTTGTAEYLNVVVRNCDIIVTVITAAAYVTALNKVTDNEHNRVVNGRIVLFVFVIVKAVDLAVKLVEVIESHLMKQIEQFLFGFVECFTDGFLISDKNKVKRRVWTWIYK